MKKNLLFTIAVCAGIGYANAQVGVNTTDPKATLHVVGTNDKGAVAAADGVLVPRVNALAVNGSEDGQLVYLIADAGTFTKGFHFWNATNSAWEPITDAAAIAGTAEIRKVAGNNIISSTAGVGNNGTTLSAGSTTGVGDANIAIGANAGDKMTSGIRNIMMGLNVAIRTDNPNNDNVYMGYNTARNSDSDNGRNIAIGFNNFRDTNGENGTDNVGGNNISIGAQTLIDAHLNSGNIALGNNSGAGDAVMNSDNIFIGSKSGEGATLTSQNVVIGANTARFGGFADRSIVIGDLAGGGLDASNQSVIEKRNILIGSEAGNSITSATVLDDNNILLGTFVGRNTNLVQDNIFIGTRVGEGVAAGSNNVLIGQRISLPTTGDPGTVDSSHQLNIQNIIFGLNNNRTGIEVNPDGRIGIGVPIPTEERLEVDGITKMDNVRVNFDEFTSTTTINKENSVIVSSSNVSLPAPTADYNGITISITNSGTTGITFNGGGTTVNGTTANTRVIPVGNTFKFTSNGTAWFITAQM